MDYQKVRIQLETLLPKESVGMIDPSDYAALSRMGLAKLNALIQETGHSLYVPVNDIDLAKETVVSLINLGCLSTGFLYPPCYA